MPLQTVVLLLLIGLCAGILSGFVGIGGGVIVVPALIFIMGLTQHEAQGTSLLLLMTPVGILAVYNYYKAGNVNIPYALTIAAGFILGAFLGSKFSLRLSPDIVRKVFGVFLLLIAIKMIFSK